MGNLKPSHRLDERFFVARDPYLLHVEANIPAHLSSMLIPANPGLPCSEWQLQGSIRSRLSCGTSIHIAFEVIYRFVVEPVISNKRCNKIRGVPSHE